MQTIVDLSIPLYDRISVFPGDEPTRLECIRSFERDGFTNYRLTTGMHAGTHIDGPMHLTNGRIRIDEIPPASFIGMGCLLDATGRKEIYPTPEFDKQIVQESIVLLRTDWSREFGSASYYRDFPIVSLTMAHLLVKKRIKMLCLDSPSPDRAPYEVHNYLLSNSILIAENVTNLDMIAGKKEIEVYAMPLRIHADSSPARILARVSE